MGRDSWDVHCQWLPLMMALASEEPVNLVTKSRCACYPLRVGGQTWTVSAGDAGLCGPPKHMLPQTKDPLPAHGTCLVLVGGVSFPRAVSGHLQE